MRCFLLCHIRYPRPGNVAQNSPMPSSITPTTADEFEAERPHLLALAYRMLGSRAEAEEAAQEVFLRAHRAIADFRGDAKLSTWLYAIASRLCMNRLASGERRLLREGEETLARIPSGHASPADELERSERDAALHRAIAELSDERRMVVVLRDLEGLSYEEIAATLGIKIGTVRSRIHRGRALLRRTLG